MRPVDKDAKPLNADGTFITFNTYQQSRRYLIDMIGEYCSYCERHISTSLAVEHIQPKTYHGNLVLVWSNLLLACTNCNSTKSHTDVILENYYWPDRHNTFEKFCYDVSGLVKVSPKLNPVDAVKAQNTISLVGLDRIQPKVGTREWDEASDRRYEHRLQAYFQANYYSKEYKNAISEDRTKFLSFLIDIAKKSIWSIWMNAFENFPEVQKALIDNFQGTRRIYFTF